MHRLFQAGFTESEVSVIVPKSHRGEVDEEVGAHVEVEKAGSHTLAAAGAGGAIGALLGGLTAAAGITASGGIGLLIAGPLLGAAGGGAAGGFIGAMSTRLVEPEIADYYDQALQRGMVLVAVEKEDGAIGPPLETAERIFKDAGAEPIDLREG